ncbi:MAG: MoxR family ATPase [Porticoccaceae bacterium]|jgi:MoxR-like ATPase|nr:MoxR family ATPase [Porticoccaceae bacterium]
MQEQQGFIELHQYLDSHIIGQSHLTQRLLIALLVGGHLLVEGAPGLAKTKAIKTLAAAIEGDFHRIQFTPDLLPADITGSDMYRPQDSSFVFQRGPIFHNLLLADEINRAPAKVQSALLEAMAEQQVSIGSSSYPLPDLFMVMATQNPIEQEGTYPLPEAQLDRFLMHVLVDYPGGESEKRILRLSREESFDTTPPPPLVLSQADIFSARKKIMQLHMADDVEEYLVQLVLATRDPAAYDNNLPQWLEFGASPRATLALDRCSRAHAWLAGRDFVTPDDIRAVSHDVLRHRIILSFEAEASGVTPNAVIDSLLNAVASA